MRLWLDDVRLAPPGWVHARTADRAIALFEAGGIVEVSLDHDLGMGVEGETAGGVLVPIGVLDHAGCGYDVATWIEVAAKEGRLPRLRWACYSQNPAGRARIEAAMRSADRAWDAHGA